MSKRIELWHYDADAGLMRRRGRDPFVPLSLADAFTLGTTEPTALNTGVLPLVARTAYTGLTTIDGWATPELAEQNAVQNKNVTQLLTIRSGYVHFRNCLFTGAGASFDTGQVNCRPADHKGTVFDRCTFDPAAPSQYLNAVIGHHMTVHRCHARRVVDFVGVYNQYGPRCDTVVTGNYLESLVRYDTDHVHSDGTHNDGIQHQGGLGLTVVGNALHGYCFYEDGSLPVDPVFRRASQGVIIQQNVPYPAGSTTYYAGDAVVSQNWVYGFMHPFSFKTRSSNGTAYDVTAQGNVLANDDQRYYGVTEFVPGYPGRPYIFRIGTQTTINGVTTVPTDGEPYPASGNNRYADTTAVIREPLRGELVTVRRDNFPGA